MPRHNGVNPPPQLLPNEQLIEMRKAGYSINFIAKKAGLKPGTLASRFRQWGVKPEFPVVAPPRTDESLYEEIRRLYWDEEKTTAEIAEILGYQSQTTIVWHMRQAGIPRRNRNEHGKLAWSSGHQPRVPRGFVLNRLKQIQDKQDDQNNDNDSADSVHN